MSVYEICDTTSDEMYFPLGIFETRNKALDAIDEHEKAKEKISEHSEEHETITIYERKFGWTEHGMPIMTIHREEYYDEDSGEYYWRKVSN